MSVTAVGPVAATVRQLTARAVVTGMVLGAVLSLCNVYSGLKVGFTVNMSIATTLLGYGVWQLARRRGFSPFGLHENLINQTAGSAAASIAGAGLVAPIPALTLLTGYEFTWGWLAAWAFSVSIVGVLVGVGLRRQLIEVQKLPFPYGIATAELLREMYERGREAWLRLRVLLTSLGIAALAKTSVEVLRIPILGLPGRIGLGGVAARQGVATASLENLGFALDPSLLMVGVGALIGFRAGASMLLGALIAWWGLAPRLLAWGWVESRGLAPDAMWFTELANWLLWPGVALMVSAALTSFVWSVAATLMRKQRAPEVPQVDRSEAQPGGISPRWFLVALALAAAFSIALQLALFDIRWHAALAAVLLSFGLAVVAGRVTGETGIAPIGAMGKVTQLAFAGISPGNATDNLMSANVTGGAASQCSDMLHDLKTGHLLGAWPRHQAIAQAFGVLAGSLSGAAVYLLLVPDPRRQLITTEWPAPAVAQWKAVAEVLARGVEFPSGAVLAIGIAGACGVALAALENGLPERYARFVPSAASIGLAFVLPAYYAFSVFIGATIALALSRWRPRIGERFTTVAAAGVIAGESLIGVGSAIVRLAMGT